MAKRRDQAKENFWRQTLRRQRSGLSVRAFCRREGLAEAAFYWWRRELGRRDQAATAPAVLPPAPAAAPAAFVPLRVVGENRLALEIVLADGACVRVRPGFDAALLRQLLAVLREAPSC